MEKILKDIPFDEIITSDLRNLCQKILDKEKSDRITTE